MSSLSRKLEECRNELRNEGLLDQTFNSINVHTNPLASSTSSLHSLSELCISPEDLLGRPLRPVSTSFSSTLIDDSATPQSNISSSPTISISHFNTTFNENKGVYISFGEQQQIFSNQFTLLFKNEKNYLLIRDRCLQPL